MLYSKQNNKTYTHANIHTLIHMHIFICLYIFAYNKHIPTHKYINMYIKTSISLCVNTFVAMHNDTKHKHKLYVHPQIQLTNMYVHTQACTYLYICRYSNQHC